jgi:hypothetical protein
MKTLGSILAVLLCVSFAQSAEVRVTRGTAYVKKAQSARWAALRGKGRVEPGDSLRTGANSLARVRTKGGHTVYVQPKTTIESVSETGKDTQFKVLVGRIRAFVQKLRPANKFEVRTPVAAAAVRGTVFDMDVSEDTSSRLSVLEGAVNYRDLAGLAKEIEVLKGQTVLIPRGQAPRPPEMMPKDLMQGAVGPRERVRREIFVEKRQDDRREGFQEEAANGQKEEQYQLGRAAVDAFGRRVRIEEFILRPAPESYAYVVVNHRDGGQTFSRLDVVASAALPARLEGLNLFNKLAPQNLDPLTLYAKSTHFLASNGQDYYREWRSGGVPKEFISMGRGTFQEVVFEHWFVEIKGAGETPELLSHWMPEASYFGGGTGYDSLASIYSLDMGSSGALDRPWGYKNYDKHGNGIIGDNKGIDAYSDDSRFEYFGNPTIRDAYNTISEGYDRVSALHPTLTTPERKFIENQYHVPGAPTFLPFRLDVQVFRVTPEGSRLNFANTAATEFNSQRVYHSSEFGVRDIDLIYSPYLKFAMGDMDDGWSDLPPGY